MDVGPVTEAPLVLAVELVVLYGAGSYAMGRLMGFTVSGGVVGRFAFYLLVFPGVVLHEGAHYLACLITGTKVVRFAPFSPQNSADGRLVLGYVRHERRSLPIRATIGLAPVLLNPLGLLFATALLTPLTFKETADHRSGSFGGGFPTDAPLLFAAWAYLSLSFALGSVPSREDLYGLPLLLLVLSGRLLRLLTFNLHVRSQSSLSITIFGPLAYAGLRIPAHLRKTVTDVEHPGVADKALR